VGGFVSRVLQKGRGMGEVPRWRGQLPGRRISPLKLWMQQHRDDSQIHNETASP